MFPNVLMFRPLLAASLLEYRLIRVSAAEVCALATLSPERPASIAAVAGQSDKPRVRRGLVALGKRFYWIGSLS